MVEFNFNFSVKKSCTCLVVAILFYINLPCFLTALLLFVIPRCHIVPYYQIITVLYYPIVFMHQHSSQGMVLYPYYPIHLSGQWAQGLAIPIISMSLSSVLSTHLSLIWCIMEAYMQWQSQIEGTAGSCCQIHMNWLAEQGCMVRLSLNKTLYVTFLSHFSCQHRGILPLSPSLLHYSLIH